VGKRIAKLTNTTKKRYRFLGANQGAPLGQREREIYFPLGGRGE
jgi:hypothetical protein